MGILNSYWPAQIEEKRKKNRKREREREKETSRCGTIYRRLHASGAELCRAGSEKKNEHGGGTDG